MKFYIPYCPKENKFILFYYNKYGIACNFAYVEHPFPNMFYEYECEAIVDVEDLKQSFIIKKYTLLE